MHFVRKSLLRAGVYGLLGGLLTIPVSCDQEKGGSIAPQAAGNSSARIDQGGCQSFTFGRQIGTWTVTGSRLQVIIGTGGKQYVGQIIEDGTKIIIRAAAFAVRGDVDRNNGGIPNINADCFEGEKTGDGWGVDGFNFQNDLGSEYEQSNAGDGSPAYRVKCSPRLNGADLRDNRVLLGFWVGCPVEARNIPGFGLAVTQNITAADPAASQGRDMFIIRGRNILLRDDVSLPFNPLDRGRTGCFSGSSTNIGGLFTPVSGNFTIPGYTLTFASDGTTPAYRQN